MKAVLVLALLLPVSAFAGKAEREYMKGTLMPIVEAAQTEYKAACGCPLKITIDEATIKTEDDMYKAKHIAEYVKDGVKPYCTDAESKKAVCKMKTLKIAKAKVAEFKFSGSAGVATHDGQGATSFEMMTRELDK